MKGHTLPRFIIFGAVKAATTWLTYQLQQNPAVYLPDPEPHYFSSEFHRGLSWYGEFFRGAAPGQLPGEKSADYLAHPDAARGRKSVVQGTRVSARVDLGGGGVIKK